MFVKEVCRFKWIFCVKITHIHKLHLKINSLIFFPIFPLSLSIFSPTFFLPPRTTILFYIKKIEQNWFTTTLPLIFSSSFFLFLPSLALTLLNIKKSLLFLFIKCIYFSLQLVEIKKAKRKKKIEPVFIPFPRLLLLLVYFL